MGRNRPETDNTEKPLGDPYPSAPSKPPRFGLAFRIGGEFDGKRCVGGKYQFLNWHSAYAAKHELELFIGEQSYKWLNNRCLKLEDGKLIQSEGDKDLDTLLEYEYANKAEREWQIPEPNYSRMLRFIGKEPAKRDTTEPEPAKAIAADPAAAQRRKRRTQKPQEAGLVSVSDIAASLGVEPSAARAALRKMKVDKPLAGWVWTDAQAGSIVDIIKKGLR